MTFSSVIEHFSASCFQRDMPVLSYNFGCSTLIACFHTNFFSISLKQDKNHRIKHKIDIFSDIVPGHLYIRKQFVCYTF